MLIEKHRTDMKGHFFNLFFFFGCAASGVSVP